MEPTSHQPARPFLWQMIKEAVERTGAASYAEIREYIRGRYGEVNANSLNAQITVCTVNQPSRIHYPENSKPRPATGRYDFLFSTGRGQVELYRPERHGQWEIRKDELGKLSIGLIEQAAPIIEPDPVGAEQAAGQPALFPLESHLRDFLARNIAGIRVNDRRLQVYTDENGVNGVEYRTGVGPVDLLAIDEAGDFVVFELKLSKGVDAALGQLLRYMGWIKHHLAGDRHVHGAIVAQTIDEKLRYAAAMAAGVTLFEYAVQFSIQPVPHRGAAPEDGAAVAQP